MTFIYALILLGILIFVHELGHFLFAKLANVKVLKFSLGFGPKVLGRKFGDTEYQISAVPLGGYVKMLGEESGDEITDEDRLRAYNFQPVWKRVLIVVAGPVFNILSACLVFYFIFLTGVPAMYPDIGRVAKNSPAASAGLTTGDRVVSVDGRKVRSWDEVVNYTEEKGGKPITLKVERGGDVLDITVTPEEKTETSVFGERKKYWDVGISPLILPVVGEVMKGTPADNAGLLKGDRIVQVDAVPVHTWEDMTEVVHGSAGKALRFRIERGGKVFERTITPEEQTMTTARGERKIGLIGIKPEEGRFKRSFGPIESAALGIERTWDISVLTIVSIVKLIQRVIPAETIGGPILIFQMAGQQASHGAMSFFSFLAIISINLGVLNLLPIPMLDGGHILFLSIEAVRRKPLSEKVIMVAQRTGLAIIITLMVFAFYNDIMRLITGKMMP